MSIDDKYKSNFDILNSDPFEWEIDLYNTTASNKLFETLTSKPKVKPKEKVNPRATKPVPGRVLPTKRSVEKSINEIQEAYSPKPQPRTVVSMGHRRKVLANQIRNNPKIKEDVLREYYEITEAIDKEMSVHIDNLERNKPK